MKRLILLAALLLPSLASAQDVGGGFGIQTSPSPGSGGNVVGPASATGGNVVLWDGTSGTLVKDGPAPSLTIAGHAVTLGGTQALACGDLSNGATGCSTIVGTAATANTGTSGTTIPYLDGANSWSAKQTTAATGVGGAGLNLPHGTAPSAPADGDLWTTTGGLYVRVNGATVGPVGSGSVSSFIQATTTVAAMVNLGGL